VNAHDAYLGRGFSSEFESTVEVPVRVCYAVDSEGRVEITHVALAHGSGAFSWQRLPPRERRALEDEAEQAAREARE
jgi:hypothetical protein